MILVGVSIAQFNILIDLLLVLACASIPLTVFVVRYVKVEAVSGEVEP